MGADVLRIKLTTVGGRVLLDIRRCLSTPSGELVPTARGFSLPPDKIAELIEKIQLASQSSTQYLDTSRLLPLPLPLEALGSLKTQRSS